MEGKNAGIRNSLNETSEHLLELRREITTFKHGVMEDLFDGGVSLYLMKRTPALQPASWSALELEDVCSGEGALAVGPSEPSLTADTADGVPVITADSIAGLRLVPEKCTHVPEGFDIQDQYRVKGADIVMVRRGHASGACAIMPVFFKGGVLSGECLRLRPDPLKADPFFLGNVLHHYYRTGVLDMLMTGGVERELSVSLLRRLQLRLPPLDEQKMISSALLELSGAIVTAEGMIEKISGLQMLFE